MNAVAFSPDDTLRASLAKLTRAFSDAGLETPEVDAKYLMRGVVGLDASDFVRHPERPLGSHSAALTQAAARRMTAREPVSRILGVREFYGRSFEITPEVLDPRPDTETLIDEVLDIVDRKNWRQAPLRIADIGLGSGCILITLLAELPFARGIGTDISPGALACARRNAWRQGVSDRLETIEASVLTGVPGPFDIVVSNPPYIPTHEIAGLARDVREYDPLLALDGGPDGLQIYREISHQINNLNQTGCAVLEAGAGQAEDISRIFGNLAAPDELWDTRYRKDLGGHVRCVTLERQSWRQSRKTVGSSLDTI